MPGFFPLTIRSFHRNVEFHVLFLVGLSLLSSPLCIASCTKAGCKWKTWNYLPALIHSVEPWKSHNFYSCLVSCAGVQCPIETITRLCSPVNHYRNYTNWLSVKLIYTKYYDRQNKHVSIFIQKKYFIQWNLLEKLLRPWRYSLRKTSEDIFMKAFDDIANTCRR